MKKGSIGLFLDHIIIRDDISNVLNEIKICKEKTNGKFMLVLFHSNLNENKLKVFAKKYSDILFRLHTKFTKNKNFRIGFFIDSFDCSIKNYRYRYEGNIYKGMQEYKNLTRHMHARDKRY